MPLNWPVPVTSSVDSGLSLVAGSVLTSMSRSVLDRGIAELDDSAIYREFIDVGEFPLFTLLIEDPVRHPVLVHFEHQMNFGQRDFRKRQMAAEEFQHVYPEIGALDLYHGRIIAPSRVAHHDVVGDDARPQRKMHVQIAIDRKASARRAGHLARDIRPGEIPVEQTHCRDEQQQGRGNPD